MIGGNSEHFSIEIELNQRSSSYLVPIFLGDGWINTTYPRDHTNDGVNTRPEVWRQILEFKGFRMSRTKIKYLYRKFSNMTNEAGLEVNLDT